MPSKVLLPKEVAEAIETLRKDGLTDYWIIVRTADAEGYNPNNVNPVAVIKRWITNTTGDWDAEEEKGTTHLLHALVNGYDVEETPEDKVREYFIYAVKTKENRYPSTESYIKYESKAETIIEVLNLLNIKIEGVNAE